MVVGGLPRDKQTFSRTAANAQSAMLMLALAALIFPVIFQLIHGGGPPGVGEERVDFGSDLGDALALRGDRAADQLRARPHLFAQDPPRRSIRRRRGRGRGGHHWPVARSDLPGAVRGGGGRHVGDPGGLDLEASEDIGLSEFFVVFVVAIVGNAAEHWVAVLVAAKDKMDLAADAIGSSAQIALFVAPVLVLPCPSSDRTRWRSSSTATR